MKLRLLFLLMGSLTLFLSSLSHVRAEVKGVASIIPHRALYDISLSHAKAGRPVQNVHGKMLYELSDTCDGWAVQQQMQLSFDFSEGGGSDVASTAVSWEARDGSAYRYNVKRVTDGREDSNYKGVVTLSDGKRVAHYSLPKDKKNIFLADADLFPTRHTLVILQKAGAGEKLFTNRIFDGSDEEGFADASTFIGMRAEPDPQEKWPDEIKDKSLLNQPSWPIRLAYYKPADQTGQPDYEMELVLQENGIARSMMIDYGDFAVQGHLVGLESDRIANCLTAK